MIYLLRTPDILVSIMVWCGPLILFIIVIIHCHSCNAHRPERDHLRPIPGWSNVISRKDTCYRRSEDDIRCPIGGNWSYYNGTNRCYKHVTTNMTWAEAKRSCEARGAELASVCDEATNNFLANLTSDPVWIGGYKKSNGWTWSDGTPWDSESENWVTGAPYKSTNNKWDYASMNHNDNGEGSWYDENEKSRLNDFICQYKSGMQNPALSYFVSGFINSIL